MDHVDRFRMITILADYHRTMMNGGRAMQKKFGKKTKKALL
jgi:hypothetical protein